MTVTYDTEPRERRPLGRAIWNGMLCRCPACGKGRLFRKYLKVNESCPNCGEELHHHRADDFPPYIAIFIVGHVLVGAMLHMEMTEAMSPMAYLLTLVPLSIVLPLIMLPSIKGGVVGMQWALGMHGFDMSVRDPALPDEA